MEEAESPPPTLRRRNSISTSLVIPSKLTSLHTSSLPLSNTNGGPSPPFDLELVSLKASLAYTSLKDILPSTALNSPTAGAATPTWGSAYEISIRNRLVKHAAWAYLQPMSASPDSSGPHCLRRLWLRFCTRNPITDCLRFISLHVIPSITEAFDRILRAIRVRTSTYP